MPKEANINDGIVVDEDIVGNEIEQRVYGFLLHTASGSEARASGQDDERLFREGSKWSYEYYGGRFQRCGCDDHPNVSL